jgi:hypothetical protein
MQTGARLILVLTLAASPGLSAAQVRAPSPTAQSILARRPWTAVLPSPTPIAAVAPTGITIAAVDLRPKIAQLHLNIRDQGNRGTCSVHAMTFLLEYMAATRRRHNYLDLSEEYLNAVANLASGKTDDGDFFAILDQGYRTYGIVPESQFPYQTAFNPGLAPSPQLQATGKSSIQADRLLARFIKPWDNATGASDAQMAQVLAQLKADVPVAVGLWWPRKGTFKTVTFGGVAVVADLGRAPGGTLVDGHSVALVGYAQHSQLPGGGYFIFRNSWGNTGDKGYGYLSFDYVRKYANDFVAYIPFEQAVADVVTKLNQK